MDDRNSRFANLKTSSFDPARLWDRVNGDKQLLRDLVKIFAQESPRMLEQIRVAIKQSAFADVQNLSHKLKGSVLQFCGVKAIELAASLEQMGERKSLQHAHRLFSDLELEIASLTRSLQTMAEIQ